MIICSIINILCYDELCYGGLSSKYGHDMTKLNDLIVYKSVVDNNMAAKFVNDCNWFAYKQIKVYIGVLAQHKQWPIYHGLPTCTYLI